MQETRKKVKQLMGNVFFIFPHHSYRKRDRVKSNLSEKFVRSLLNCEVKYNGDIYDVRKFEESESDLLVHCIPIEWRLR